MSRQPLAHCNFQSSPLLCKVGLATEAHFIRQRIEKFNEFRRRSNAHQELLEILEIDRLDTPISKRTLRPTQGSEFVSFDIEFQQIDPVQRLLFDICV